MKHVLLIATVIGVFLIACSQDGTAPEGAPADTIPSDIAPLLTPQSSVDCGLEPVSGALYSGINCDYGTYSTCTIIADGDIRVFFPTDALADIQYDDLVGTTTIRFTAPCIFWQDYVPELSDARSG